jgi:hypothetical protein
MGIMGSLRVSNFSLVWLTYTAFGSGRVALKKDRRHPADSLADWASL